MKFVKRISRIGVKNAGILDIERGEVVGPAGSFLISEDLLPKMALRPFEWER